MANRATMLNEIGRPSLVAHQKNELKKVAPAYLFYTLGHLILMPLWAAKGCYRSSQREYRKILWQRLLIPRLPRSKVRVDVVYAIGIGELRTAVKFVQVLHAERGTDGVVLSETEDFLQAHFQGAPIFPAPFNNPFSVLRALLVLRPRAIWIVETIRNHHLKVFATLLGIPTILINTHDSIKNELLGGGANWRIPIIGLYAVQSQSQAEALTKTLIDPEYVIETGPIGLGSPNSDEDVPRIAERFRDLLQLTETDTPVILAGSTHESDEVLVVNCFKELLKLYPKARLILAPRYIRRAGRVAHKVGRFGLQVRLRSNAATPEEGEVIVLDTVGELRDLYSVADIAYVGGTSAPGVGGHTPMEAFTYGIPIFSGPHYDHQRVATERLREAGILRVVQSEAELLTAMISELQDPSRRERIARLVGQLQAKFDEDTVTVFDEIQFRFQL